MTFSTPAQQAIESFAVNLGLNAEVAPDGSYSFHFEQSGLLTFTSARDGVRTLLSLVFLLERVDEETERRLLAMAGPDISTERFLSTGLTGTEGGVFAVNIYNEEINLATLEICLQQLMTARTRIR